VPKDYVYPRKLPNEVCLKFGFVDGQQSTSVYNAMLMSDSKNKNLDGLFEWLISRCERKEGT
jgi:hypothetical protein